MEQLKKNINNKSHQLSPAFNLKVKRFHIITINGTRIGYTGIISTELPILTRSSPVTAFNPIQGLRDAITSMRNQGVNIIIVASVVNNRTMERFIGENVDGVDIIISADQILFKNDNSSFRDGIAYSFQK